MIVLTCFVGCLGTRKGKRKKKSGLLIRLLLSCPEGIFRAEELAVDLRQKEQRIDRNDKEDPVLKEINSKTLDMQMYSLAHPYETSVYLLQLLPVRQVTHMHMFTHKNTDHTYTFNPYASADIWKCLQIAAAIKLFYSKKMQFTSK